MNAHRIFFAILLVLITGCASHSASGRRCPNVLPVGQSCCDGEILPNHQCCGGHKLGPEQECCGRYTFELMSEICCGGKIYKRSHTECCDHTPHPRGATCS